MKKIWTMILLSVIPSITNAQFNLVTNSSFEDTISGTSCYCQDAIELCVKNWFNPHGATPDYYTYFPGYCTGISSMNNPNGFQLARTGNGYAGIYGIVFPTREYVAIHLIDSLVQGVCYYAEFYVSLANLCKYAIDNLGCYFTNDTSGYKSFYTNIQVTPQVQNQIGNFLSDTLNWQKVSGTFIASGGETFLIIGNFYNDLNTPLDTVNSSSNWQAAYYYVDDALVAPCDSVVGLNKIIPLELGVYPVPSSNKLIVSSMKSSQKLHLDLFDLTGTEQTSKILLNRSDYGWQIDISNLSNGVYILTVTDGIGICSKFKVIKQ